VSAVSIADSGPVLVDLLAAPGKQKKLEVVITDEEGPVVSGATVVGPIKNASTLAEVLGRAGAAYSSLCPSPSATEYYEPARPGISAYLRITLRQVMGPGVAALLAGGAAGTVSGVGAGLPDGSVEVESDLVLVCAPTAAYVLKPLAHSALTNRFHRTVPNGGRGGQGERLFPPMSREEVLAVSEGAEAVEEAAKAKIEQLWGGRRFMTALTAPPPSTLNFQPLLVPPSPHPLSLLLGEVCGACLGAGVHSPASWLTLVLAGIPSQGVHPNTTLDTLHWLELIRGAITFPLVDSANSRAAAYSHRRSLRLLRHALEVSDAVGPLAGEERMLLAQKRALDTSLELCAAREEITRLSNELALRPSEGQVGDLRRELLTLRESAGKAQTYAGECEVRIRELQTDLESRGPDFVAGIENFKKRTQLTAYSLALRRRLATITSDPREKERLLALEVAAGCAGLPLTGVSLGSVFGDSQGASLVEARMLSEAVAGLGVTALPPPVSGTSSSSSGEVFLNPTTHQPLFYDELTALAHSLESKVAETHGALGSSQDTLSAYKRQLLAARAAIKGAKEEIERSHCRIGELGSMLEERSEKDGDRGSVLKALTLLKAHAISLNEKIGWLEAERNRLRGALGEALTRVETVTEVALRQGKFLGGNNGGLDGKGVEQDSANDLLTLGRSSSKRGGYHQPRRHHAEGLEEEVVGGGESDSLRDSVKALSSGNSALLSQLKSSEKRCIELLGSNATLSAQVDALKGQLRASSARVEDLTRASNFSGKKSSSESGGWNPIAAASELQQQLLAHSVDWGTPSPTHHDGWKGSLRSPQKPPFLFSYDIPVGALPMSPPLSPNLSTSPSATTTTINNRSKSDATGTSIPPSSSSSSSSPAGSGLSATARKEFFQHSHTGNGGDPTSIHRPLASPTLARRSSSPITPIDAPLSQKAARRASSPTPNSHHPILAAGGPASPSPSPRLPLVSPKGLPTASPSPPSQPTLPLSSKGGETVAPAPVPSRQSTPQKLRTKVEESAMM